MGEFNSSQFEGESLDHLGLVAATIDYLGLEKLIDDMLPISQEKGAKVPMSKRVSAMIMNGLGFIDDRLYMFPEFIEGTAIDRLLGPGLKAEYFNDDAIGRCLDAISDYGVTKFFSTLAFSMGRTLKLLGPTLNLDTTTLSLSGEYEDYVLDKEKPETVVPAYGYSKQKRRDLKQVVLLLATTGKANFPLLMSLHSGNASDQKTLHEAMEKINGICKGLEDSPSFIYVADSASYLQCVEKNTEGLRWVSRVPETIKEAKNLVAEDGRSWSEYGNGYKISPHTSHYGKVTQRWILVYSEQAYHREIKTVERKIPEEKVKQEKIIASWAKGRFESEQEAKKAIKELEKTLKYHSLKADVQPIMKPVKKRKSKPEEASEVKSYAILGILSEDVEAIAKAKRSCGRFIVATNELSQEALSDAGLLKEYKSQSELEKGFAFIKDDTFELSSVFLKTPSRIEALMAVMVLCLMVYNVSQYRLRKALKENNDSILNQVKKPTDKPSMKWVYRIFTNVMVLNINVNGSSQQVVINVKDRLLKIIRYFGPKAMEIYSVEACKAQ